MIWTAISCYSAGPITTLSGRITARENVDILGSQVYPVVQMFPNNDAIFQDDNPSTHRARSVQSKFEGQEDSLEHLP